MSGTAAGHHEFNRVVGQLPVLLERLVNSPMEYRKELGSLPKKGVYVFYEAGRAVYVGRSDSMKRRLQEHGRASSGHNSSTFAFILAKKEAAAKGIDTGMPRGDLEQTSAFARVFSDQKARVSRMGIRTIGVDDPVLQTLLEVYASLVLETTENNRFENH